MDRRFALSRRSFLKGVAVTAGAAAGTRLAGGSWLADAQAAGEPAAVVILHLVGGYNALFCSADSLVGKFGITANNHTILAGGVGIDNTWNSTMSNFAKTHMATIGVRHGISSHTAARRAVWSHNNQNAGLVLANTIGGTASIKAAVVGGTLISDAPSAGVNGVSFQSITDMQKTIDALGGGTPNPRVPDRAIALGGMQSADLMSENAIKASPRSLESLDNGYQAAIATLKQPVKVFDPVALRTAYGLANNTTAVRDFKSKLAAAELMVSAGTNVVALFDGGWDTHGDTTGNNVRNKMTSYVLSPLNTFINRVVADPMRNVTLVILGDFARSLPGSDHQPNLSVTVIGRYVKPGTTGKVDANVRLPTSAPSVPGLWAYLNAVAKTSSTPFGANPHALVA